jgi:hypothetical protein
VVLAVALFLLILIKVSIPRFFRALGRHLFLIGTGVYLTAFTLVTITAGYYLIWKYKEEPYISHAALPEKMVDIDLGKELFIVKCSTCHLLQNIMKPRSPEAWERVVNDMVVLAEPRISAGEAQQILNYLSETHIPAKEPAATSASLLERHCLPCHNAKDIWSHDYSRSGWREIVKTMNGYDPDIVPLEKTKEMVDYLIANQEEN